MLGYFIQGRHEKGRKKGKKERRMERRRKSKEGEKENRGRAMSGAPSYDDSVQWETRVLHPRGPAKERKERKAKK